MATEPMSGAWEEVLDAVAGVVLVVDPEGRIVGFNRACEKLTGYKRAEVCGRSVWESVLVPEQAGAGRARLARLADGGESRLEFESQWRTRAGDRRHISWRSRTVRDEAGKLRYVVSTGTDVTEQRRAERSLRASEGLLHKVADAVNGVFWMTDPGTAELVYVSPAYEKVWGCPLAEVYANPRSFLDAVVDEDRARAEAALAQIASSGDTEVEYRIRRPDGSVVWINDRSFPIHGDDGQLYRVCGIAEDVTARKAAEEALLESNDRYQALFDATTDAVVMHDGGIVLQVNRRCCEMFGYPPEELLGQDGLELVFPPASRERVKRLLAAGHQGAYEVVMRRKDGSTFLAEVNTRTTDYRGRRVRVASNRDITEQRRAETALRESEQRLRLAVGHSPDLMFHQDLELRYTWFSRTVPPVTPAEMIGKTDDDLVAVGIVEADQAPALIEAKRRVLHTGVGERIETGHRIGDATLYFETALEPHLDAGGRVAGIAGYARDVTERKLAEQALRGANEALERRVAERTAELEARTRELEARSAQLARSEQELREQGRLLRLILDHMGDGVAVADQDGHFLLFNPAAERIIGTRATDMPLEQWPQHFRFCLPDARTPYPAHELPLQRALRGESTDDVEIFVRHPGRSSGSWISTTARPIYDEHGRLAGGVTVIHDLTERKAAERALRQGEARYERAAEAGRVGIWELDLVSGELYLSPNLKRLLGYGDDELPNGLDAWYDLMHPDDKPPTIDATDAHVNGHTPLFQAEVRRRHRDGEYRWFLAQGTAVRDDAGKPYRMVGSDTDITERKLFEGRLRESEQHHRRLAEHNRWLVRELEHRVGNNLASLLALVSVMRGRSTDVAGFADAIEARLHAMSSVHRLLATAGAEPVALGAVVRAALSEMRCMASHAPDEVVAGPEVELPKAQVLPLMLILVEWYTNSCKYGVHAASGRGKLAVTWDATTAGGAEVVTLHWRERGGPPVHGAAGPSLGTLLVNEFAQREMGGACTMRFPTEGAEHTLEFPIAP